MKPLKKKINSSLVYACSTLVILSFSSASYAGFEWVPPQNSTAAIVIEQAPVEPVIGEPLNNDSPVSMVPAPNAGMDMPDTPDMHSAKIKTLDFDDSSAAPEIMLPPPVNRQETSEAKAITVKELESSEKTVEITQEAPAQTAEQETAEPQNAPISLIPQEDITNNEAPAYSAAQPSSSSRTMIKPFPILKKDQPQDSFAPIENVETVTPRVESAAVIPQNTIQSEKEIALGFGKNMPLALALKQIIPDNYAYAFGAGVNPGQLVSWNGGKSWDIVLQEALTPLNLDIYFQNKKVTIYNPGTLAPEKTSYNQDKDANRVAVVEPAAGTEMPSGGSAMRENLEVAAIPLKRTNIQDPGELANEDVSTGFVAENSKATLYPEKSSTKPLWSAQKGASLKDTLYSWSRKTDSVQIIWEASHDYKLDKDFEFMGNTKQAFQYLLQSGTDIKSNITPRFIENSTAPGNVAMIIVQDSEQAMKNASEDVNTAG